MNIHTVTSLFHENTMDSNDMNCYQCTNVDNEEFCHVTMNSINKMKQSTRKLLDVLDDIQSKAFSKIVTRSNTFEETKEYATLDELDYYTAREDTCSVYDRLIGRCTCLNHPQYNDLIIHFSETDYKHKGYSVLGQIIKNLRILKKFIYIGGGYSQNALLFLNEGLSDCLQHEKLKIVEGCSYADVCNVFEDYSIVKTCILWPCKAKVQDFDMQSLTAEFLYKLSNYNKGKEYLNFNTKIGNEVKKLIQKTSAHLENSTMEYLKATLSRLRPPLITSINSSNIESGFQQQTNTNKGMAIRIINTLRSARQEMNIHDILTHLDILRNVSDTDSGKNEIRSDLGTCLELFRKLLVQYDNSEMNILISNILDNAVPRFGATENVEKQVRSSGQPLAQVINELKVIHNKKSSKLSYPRKKHFTLKNKDRNAVIVVPIEDYDLE